MKITIILFLLFLSLSVSTAFAQYDVIALYNDSLRTDCDIPWSESFSYFYIFHYSRTGASGCRFRIPRVPCMNFGGIVGPTIHNPGYSYVGDLETGITFNYGACLSGWIYLAAVSYWDVLGLSGANCCEQVVLEHPDATTGQPEVFDCEGQSFAVDGISGFITEQPNCDCTVPTGILSDKDTWGAIKEMYSKE